MSSFKQYWQDYPFKVYLLSSYLGPSAKTAESFKVGKDVSWSENLRKALEALEEDYVFMAIEGLSFTKEVNTPEALILMDWAVSKGANYFGLNPYPAPDEVCRNLIQYLDLEFDGDVLAKVAENRLEGSMGDRIGSLFYTEISTCSLDKWK